MEVTWQYTNRRTFNFITDCGSLHLDSPPLLFTLKVILKLLTRHIASRKILNLLTYPHVCFKTLLNQKHICQMRISPLKRCVDWVSPPPG